MLCVMFCKLELFWKRNGRASLCFAVQVEGLDAASGSVRVRLHLLDPVSVCTSRLQLGQFVVLVFAALQGSIYAASSAAEVAQTRLGVDATVAIAARTSPRELEHSCRQSLCTPAHSPPALLQTVPLHSRMRAEAEIASKAAASSQAGAAMLVSAGGQRRTAVAELADRIAEVEAEAARRLAVSTKACVRPEIRDYSVPSMCEISARSSRP
jgi:hypothetical protein